MSLAKFVSLLANRALDFCRVDKLEDIHEERLTKSTYEITHEWLRAGYEGTSRETIVDCWSMVEQESVGLRKTYVPHSEGVAVRTTFARLKDSFERKGVFQEATLHVSVVRYVDFNTYSFVDETNTAFNRFIPLLHKRRFFEYGHELRAVVSGLGTHFLGAIIRQTAGMNVPVSLKTLIDRVHVAPLVPPSFAAAVRSVAEKYGVETDLVVQSGLDKPLRSSLDDGDAVDGTATLTS